MRYKAVIFDLDGTLVDSLEDIMNSMNKVLLEKGYMTYDLQDYRYFVGNGLKNLVRRALPEGLRDEDYVAECFELMMLEYQDRCLATTQAYAGIQEMLLELQTRGLKLAVFSNKVDVLAKKIVSTLFPKIKFEMVIGVSTQRPKKPNPEGALYISRELNLTPAEFVFVGDSGVDMQTAQAANMDALGVLWGYREKEELEAKGAKSLAAEPKDIIKTLFSSNNS